MYAIVEIAGQQFKVVQNQKLFVHRLPQAEGTSVSFSNVLLVNGGDNHVSVGLPIVPDAYVNAKILEHTRGDKVLVFKKKRRKGYRKLNGHRQQFTQIEIESITV